MGFARKTGFAAVLFVLLCGTSVGASAVGNPEIEVLVFDNGPIPPAVLDQAESETARIFRQAGIKLKWVNCVSKAPVPEECHFVPGPGEYVLRIVSGMRLSNHQVFGVAFLGPDGTGKYADLFLDRIEEEHRQSGVNIPRLLGALGAHELGHLLLGPHAHLYLGIMSPQWENSRLQRVDMGDLLFTNDQASHMRARIRAEESEEFRLARGAGK